MRDTVLILGGAGFIGSHIVKRFYNAGHDIIVVDGLLEQTGGRRENLIDVISNIEFIPSRIEDIKNIDEVIAKSDVIIDCMAWTSHRIAFLNPFYDLKLNLESHLYFLQHLNKNKKIIYLGSRSQYGNPNIDEITEETPMIPIDIQGINKVATESYYRVYAKLKDLNIVTLKFSNCFGENQLIEGDDIGLIGSFIRDMILNKNIEVFGNGRKRSLVYVRDLSEVVFQLSMKQYNGFLDFNLNGHNIYIEELVKMLIELIGKGTYQIRKLTDEIKFIDSGNAKLNDTKLRNFLGGLSISDLQSSLLITTEYFKKKLL